MTNLLNLLFTWILTESSISGASVEWSSRPSELETPHLAARIEIFPASVHDRERCHQGFFTLPSARGMVDGIGGLMSVREGGFLDLSVPLADPATCLGTPLEMEKMLADFPDPVFCRCLIANFFVQTKKLLEDLPEHLNSRNFSAVHRIAHTIKGGALNIHALELSRTAKEFEHDAKARRLENAAFYTKKLLHELSSAEKYFRATSGKEHDHEQ